MLRFLIDFIAPNCKNNTHNVNTLQNLFFFGYYYCKVHWVFS